MKKRIIILLVALLCMSLLTGCFCQHEVWLDATCDTPRTCESCGKTEGEALGHVWLAATCEEPKTCETCGTTEGEPKGHDMVAATCEEPEHCTHCDLTEGTALGHVWLEATTEAPQTCETCGATEGERIITDERFTTAATKKIQGLWAAEVMMTAAEMGLEEEVIEEMPLLILMDFRNDGTMAFSAEIPDEEAFIQTLVDGYSEMLYAEFASYGMSREEADAAMEAEYGMGVREYMEAALGEISFNDLLAAVYEEMNLGGVYYMEGGKLYTGTTWEGAMTEESYTLTGDTLVIDSVNEALSRDVTFTRN